MLSRALRRAGGERDPNFGQVGLLLPFDDDFSDRGPNRFEPTLVGSPALVSDGGGTGAFWWLVGSFNGAAALQFANNAAFQIGTGEFTVECNFTVTGSSGTYTVAAHGVSGSNGWVLRVLSTGAVEFLFGASSSFSVAGAGFVDFTRPGNRYYVKVIRTAEGFNACRASRQSSGVFVPPDNWVYSGFSLFPTANTYNFNTTANLFIGQNRGAAQRFVGYIEEFRLTVGHARLLNARQARPWPQK